MDLDTLLSTRYSFGGARPAAWALSIWGHIVLLAIVQAGVNYFELFQ